MANPIRIATVALHSAPVMALALDEDRGLAISADTQGRVIAWPLPRYVNAIGQAPPIGAAWELREDGAVYALASARKGKTDLLVTAGAFPRLGVYARADGAPRTHLPLAGYDSATRDMAVLPDRQWLYAVAQSGRLVAFDIATGNRLLAEASGLTGVRTMTARPDAAADAAMLAVGGTDGTLAVLQHTPGGLARVRQHALGEQVLYDLHVVDSGDAAAPHLAPGIVCAGSAGTVFIQGQLDAVPQPVGDDTGEVFALAVTPDGRRVITGGDNGVATVRDLATGQTAGHIRGPVSGAIQSLAITPDGRLALVGDATGKIHVYDLTPLDG